MVLIGWKTIINLKLFQELGLTRLVENFSLPRMKEPRRVSEPLVVTMSQSSISENCSIAFLHRPQVNNFMDFVFLFK